jgi:signal transduction histidine kinase
MAPKQSFKYYSIPGILYPYFFLLFLGIVIYAHYELFDTLKKSSGIKRNQFKYVALASMTAFIFGSTSYFVDFNINIYPVGNCFVWIYPIITSYAIVKHRLMDITFVVKKGVAYAYASFLLLIPLFFLVIYGQKATFDTINYPFTTAILLTIIIAAYFFPKVKVQAEKTVEQFIFKNKYDYRKTISDLSRAMVSILNTHDLCSKIINTTTEAMVVEKASIYIIDEEEGFYKRFESMGLDQDKIVAHYHRDDPFFKWIERHNEIFIREELERYTTNAEAMSMAERMGQMESEICIPLITKQKLIGIINMGMKGKGDMYTHEDLQLLTTLSNQASIAIENAKLYEDISRARVQMQRADRLASLGTLTAGLAHEIRNPLVAIKTFTQLLPERLDDEEFRNHFLNVTAGEVDRISSLVNELLEFARPSQPNLNREDLNQVVERMLLLIATASHKKNLQIVKEYQPSLPPVLFDKEQIKQVLFNVLLNAIDAAPENSTITVGTRLLEKNGYQDQVQIMVRDNGKGIPKEDVDKIFTPFYTTKRQGSGLGLAISHQIIEEHHGTIEVESEENQGATFYINLPVNPLLNQEGKQWRGYK